MRTKRLRETITKILEEEGPLATHQILEKCNSRLRHGTTSNQLGNVLSKRPEFKKVGTTMRGGFLTGAYEVCVWTTAHAEDTSGSEHP